MMPPRRTDHTDHSLAGDPSRAFRMCMYTPSASGGHARYTHELLLALTEVGRERGFAPSLVTSRDLAPQYRDTPYEIHDILPPLRHRSEFRTPLNWALSRTTHYLRRERVFLRWAESGNCDGVHFQEYAPWLAPGHFRRLRSRGVRLFFTVHNIYPHVYLPGVPESLYQSWNRSAWRVCDGLFVLTETLRDELSDFLGAGHPPINVVPHGMWNDSEGESLVEGDPEPRRLLFFGVIRANKGLHVLLEAMKQLDDCTLTVAGAFEDAAYRERVMKLVEELPNEKIELVEGFVEDEEVAEFFDRSALVVIPYTSFAAQSGVLHDALSYRVPVVATDVGAVGESVRGWGVGEVARPGSVESLAEAVRAALAPGRYEDVRDAVRRTREELSWTRAAGATIDGYLAATPKTERMAKG